MTGNGHVRFGGGLPQKYRPDEGRQLGGGLPNQPFVISWSERRRFLAADLLAANANPVAVSPRLLRRALTSALAAQRRPGQATAGRFGLLQRRSHG